MVARELDGPGPRPLADVALVRLEDVGDVDRLGATREHACRLDPDAPVGSPQLARPRRASNRGERIAFDDGKGVRAARRELDAVADEPSHAAIVLDEFELECARRDVS